jgi:hypothetical protein
MIRHLLAAAATLAVLASTVGCTSTVNSAAPSGAPTDSSISVETRSITSVLVVRGTVAASPTIVIAAPNFGTWKPNTSAVQSASVAAGADLGRVGDAPVTAPVSGRVQAELILPESNVAAHTPLLEFVYSGFAINLTVPADQLYRLYSTATTGTASVTSGPAGVDCTIVPVVGVSTQSGGKVDSGAAMSCLLPSDADVVPGLDAKVGIRTAEARGVLAVPVSSVLGSTQSGLVTRVRAGKSDVVKVELGISDGAWVEVRSGLRVGDRVLAYAPGLN